MGSAILKQGLEKKIFIPKDVLVHDKDTFKAEAFKSQGVQVHSSLDDVSGFKTIILAVKPGDMSAVLGTISGTLDADANLISVAAGLTLEYLRKQFGKKNPIARIMPNLNALSGAGMSAICFEKNAPEQFKKDVINIFNSLGQTLVVEEAKMDAVTGLSGSGPAFVFMFISSLIEGGIKAGLSKDEAFKLAIHTVEGSVKTVLKTGEDPESLKNRVASPNGTTIEGINALEKLGFRSAVMVAVEAAAKRSAELTEKYK
jgi:pyrroline-5-carboxylate reductase